MTFLAPMAGLIGAAICVPVLLAVYMLRLRRRPVRVSSTLFWEQAARDVQANVPLRWLRPSVLMLLQLLALASFLIALSRPALDAGSRPVSRLVVLIDASASMAAPGTPDGERSRTRLEEAKAQATEIVERAMRSSGGASHVAVISFGSAPALTTAFTSDRRRALRGIASIEQTDQPGDLEAALRLVEAQAAGVSEDGAGGGIRLVLVSDGGLARSTRSTIGNAEFVFVRVGPAPDAARDNLGVAQLSVRRDYDDPALVRVFARVINAGPTGLEAALTLRADGAPVRATTVSAPAAGPEGPGEAPVAIDVRRSERATLTLSIERADDLAADDSASVVIGPALRLRLLLVAPGGEGGDPDPFLGRALEALDPQQFSRVSIAEYEQRVTEPGWLEQYSMAVFDRTSPAAPPFIPSLSFGSAAALTGVTLSAPVDGTARIASWDRASPIMRHVSLDALLVRDAPVIEATPSAGARVRTLAQSEAGPVIVLVEDGAAPRLIVSFDLAQSNWPVQVGFAVFLANATASLAPGATGAPGMSVTTSDPAIVRAAAGVTEVIARGPIERTARVPPGQRVASFGLLPRAGIYFVENAAPGDETLAVNLANASESAIVTSDDAPRVGGGEGGRGVSAAAPQEVWRWFVLLGFGLATLEWLLQAWRLRR